MTTRAQRRLSLGLAISALALAGLSPAAAQDITYQPIDPSFGGNPFNSAHLLGIANAQNDYKDPKAASTNSQVGNTTSSASGQNSSTPVGVRR